MPVPLCKCHDSLFLGVLPKANIPRSAFLLLPFKTKAQQTYLHCSNKVIAHLVYLKVISIFFNLLFEKVTQSYFDKKSASTISLGRWGMNIFGDRKSSRTTCLME